MELELLLIGFAKNYPIVGTILMVLGLLVVLGYLYVKISPNKDDDAFLSKLEALPIIGHLLKALKSFSPIQSKSEDK